MIGTTKQVAWAQKIRSARIAELEALFAVPTDDPAKIANRAKILDAVRSDTITAKRYIDSRRYDARSFAQDVLGAIQAAGMTADDSERRMCEMAAMRDAMRDR